MIRALRLVALASAGAAAIWVGGLVWFAQTIPAGAAVDPRATDAIVVLTGGPARLRAGFELLAAGSARRLLVSGVSRGVDAAELLRVAGHASDRPDPRIAVGYAAESTAGNAAETRAWMAREGLTSLRLVTASYHMPRSLIEFHSAMPGTPIVPHPVATDGFRREAWWAWPGTLRLVVSEYNKTLAALARTRLGIAGERTTT